MFIFLQALVTGRPVYDDGINKIECGLCGEIDCQCDHELKPISWKEDNSQAD